MVPLIVADPVLPDLTLRHVPFCSRSRAAGMANFTAAPATGQSRRPSGLPRRVESRRGAVQRGQPHAGQACRVRLLLGGRVEAVHLAVEHLAHARRGARARHLADTPWCSRSRTPAPSRSSWHCGRRQRPAPGAQRRGRRVEAGEAAVWALHTPSGRPARSARLPAAFTQLVAARQLHAVAAALARGASPCRTRRTPRRAGRSTSRRRCGSAHAGRRPRALHLAEVCVAQL